MAPRLSRRDRHRQANCARPGTPKGSRNGPRGIAKSLRRLTTAAGDDSHPHWSADGKRIFFNSARATPDPKSPWGQQRHDIFSMAGDGSDAMSRAQPSFSSDGKTIFFYEHVEDPRFEIGHIASLKVDLPD